MTRTMNLLTAMLLAGMVVGANAWSRAEAADDAHRHDRTPPAAAATTAREPDQTLSSKPMPPSAEDMLRAMETMPAHDDAHCCGIRDKNTTTHEHDH